MKTSFKINYNSPASTQQGEKIKQALENRGYRLQFTERLGVEEYCLTYIKIN